MTWLRGLIITKPKGCFLLLYFKLVLQIKFLGLHKVLGKLVYGIVIIVSVRELWAVLRMGPCIIYKKNEFQVLSRNKNVSLATDYPCDLLFPFLYFGWEIGEVGCIWAAFFDSLYSSILLESRGQIKFGYCSRQIMPHPAPKYVCFNPWNLWPPYLIRQEGIKVANQLTFR